MYVTSFVGGLALGLVAFAASLDIGANVGVALAIGAGAFLLVMLIGWLMNYDR